MGSTISRPEIDRFPGACPQRAGGESDPPPKSCFDNRVLRFFCLLIVPKILVNYFTAGTVVLSDRVALPILVL
jgi:hypothetical protein